MRLDRLLLVAAFALPLFAGISPEARAQDFDPHGRHHGPPPKRPGGTAGTGSAVKKPPGAATAKPEGGDNGVSNGALIDRYTKIVLQQAGSPFPLQRLAQLYRDRDGKLDGLVKDFEAKAAAPGADQYAATAALAGIYKIEGRSDDAAKTFGKAIALKPTDPAAILALAHLLQDKGDLAGARAKFEEALPLQTASPDKEQTLRTLETIALDAKDWANAKAVHDRIVKLQPNNLFVRGELGRELYARGEYDKAEAEFKDLVQASQGDNRTLAPALKDLGKAQAKAHKDQDALATLKKAMQTAGAEAAVRKEIYETIAEVYRANQTLPVFITELEAQHPSDFLRLALLGNLYEETGDVDKAMKTYQKALAQNPRDIDLRLKVVRLLQASGEIDKAIAEYEGLIRAAPNNPQFVFEQCDALMQRGDRARAVKLLTELEARAGSDEDTLSRLADFYGRIGEGERSVRVLTKLALVGSNDPSHLTDLGDRYYQDGNRALAIATWRKILTSVVPRGRALAALGDVYLEHDMTQEALAAYKEAVASDPANAVYKKQLAGAYERTKDWREAIAIWQELQAKAKTANDGVLAREVRTNLVKLWTLDHQLESHAPKLVKAFGGAPPDLEAGRVLAEVQMRQHRPDDAEATYRKVLLLAPGDAETYLALERILVQEGKLKEAIAVLEKLAVVDPKQARQLYQRMAQYALQLYKDDDAIKYAARAVELNPDDAEGHRRLAEMYQKRQDTERAIKEFKEAIAKNDRLFVVYFELADLLVSRGQTEEADRLFRRVIRSAPDEELVARAARLSMQINLGKGTLESLEQELLPMAIGNPQKAIYRRLLVEIYGNLTYALVQRVHRAHFGDTPSSSGHVGDTPNPGHVGDTPNPGGDGQDADEARAALARIGSRAIKPLLDALVDQDGGQQRIAIDVLAYVENKNAAPPLFSFATGPGDPALRARAMVACGALKDAALLPKFKALLLPKEGADPADVTPSDDVATAAAWGLAKLGDPKALPVLRELLREGTPEVRGLAALGIAAQKDRSEIPELAKLARSVEAGNVARAAAAYALAELGAEGETGVLLALADDDDLPREAAIAALARLLAGKPGTSASATGALEPQVRASASAAVDAMARALFTTGDAEDARGHDRKERLSRTAAGALALMALGRSAAEARAPKDLLPVPEGGVDVGEILLRLAPSGFSAKERLLAFNTYRVPIAHAAKSALETSSAGAHAVLEAVGPEHSALKPLVTALEVQGDKAAASSTDAIAVALTPGVLALAKHPDLELRTRAVGFLAHVSGEAPEKAMADAVLDPNESVVRVALASLGGAPNPPAAVATAEVAKRHANWAVRVLAVQALGRLMTRAVTHEGTATLTERATSDPFALVREAALSALAASDPKAGAEVAKTLAEKDPEPHVREVAKLIAKGGR